MQRVIECVRHGGHDIPVPDIRRRFFRSLHNLFSEYASLVDGMDCFLNSGKTPKIVFRQEGEHRELKLPSILRILENAGAI